MKNAIIFGAALAVLILPEFCTPRQHKISGAPVSERSQFGVSFNSEAWAEQRQVFLEAIGVHVDDIDHAVQRIEAAELQGPLSQRRKVLRRIQETRFLLEDIRSKLRYQVSLNRRLWSRERTELIASVNDLKSKYESVRDVAQVQ